MKNNEFTEKNEKQLLEDFLALPPEETSEALLAMDFEQLQTLVNAFTVELKNHIQTLPKMPQTAKTRQFIRDYANDPCLSDDFDADDLNAPVFG